MTSTVPQRSATISPTGAGAARRAVRRLRSGQPDAAVDADRAASCRPRPQPAAVPMSGAGPRCCPLAERAGELVPVGRGGERRAIALANPGLPGTAVRHADAVGRDPVPRPARGRARAPAHPDRVPVRGRGRGRLDQRRRRPGRDAARRPAAHPGHALPRAPQHDRPPDGVDRRPGHPAGPHDSTPGSSSSAPTSSPTRETPEASRNERLWGHPGLRPGRRSCARRRRR